MRSLYEPVGLAASILTQTSAPPASGSRDSWTTGGPPIAARPPGRCTQNLLQRGGQPIFSAGRAGPAPRLTYFPPHGQVRFRSVREAFGLIHLEHFLVGNVVTR